MSDLYNQMFINMPLKFIDTYVVDILKWLEAQNNPFAPNLEGKRIIQVANDSKTCHADFDPLDGFLGFGVDTLQFRMLDAGGIDAYWVPYHSEVGLPGYADVERVNPVYHYVFTPGMNGCAWVVTGSPLGANYMRIYHHPHPERKEGQITRVVNGQDVVVNVVDGTSDAIWQAIRDEGQPILKTLTFAEYNGGPLPTTQAPVAFNFLYYQPTIRTWNFGFQPQYTTIHSQKGPQRIPGGSGTRPVF